jgi:hypothetical protein
MLPRLLALGYAAAVLLPAQVETTRIFGAVSDLEGAAIANAEVRLISAQPPFKVSRTRADRNGSFEFQDARFGDYTIRAGGQGFREEIREHVTVRANRTNRVDLRLDVIDCDTPLVNCDTFEFDDHPPHPPPLPYFRKGEVVLNRNCGIDLDKGGTACPTNAVAPNLDLWVFQRADSRLELRARNRAALSVGLPVGEHCSNQNFQTTSYLITGLGPGTELCVLTKRHHRALIYVEEEVGNGSSSAKLYYATYK